LQVFANFYIAKFNEVNSADYYTKFSQRTWDRVLFSSNW